MLYCFGYWVVRFLYFLFYHIQVEGREHIPTSGGFVLASNHRSYADPPLLATRLRGQRCVFMAKEELFRNKFFGWLIRKLGAFPVTRGAGDNGVIETAEQYVRSGRVLMIFPEGTRSKDGRVGRGKTGVALIAAQTGAPVVPVAISGARGLFEARGNRATPGTVYVRVLPPIQTAGMSRAEQKQLPDAVRQAILAQL